MKRILKIMKRISKIGVATIILTSFSYTLESCTNDAVVLILFTAGCFCALYYFVFMEE